MLSKQYLAFCPVPFPSETIMKKPRGLPTIMELLLIVLALGGFGINLLLLIRHMEGGGIAGCGSGSACEEMLNSRWSQVLGVPVTVFGGLVYLALMFALVARVRLLSGICLGLILGAAAWFVFVQAALIGRFCPWCMTAHAIGVIVALSGMRFLAAGSGGFPALRTIGGAAAISVGGIALMQVFGPLPVTHIISGMGGAANARSAAVHARGAGRKVKFDGGGKVYDLSALPYLGRPDARRVMVEYFDYTCATCQRMSGYLDALLAKHPAGVCVVVLPVPLGRSCNHQLGTAEPDHPESCELAKLALALWRVKPPAFANFHQSLLGGISARTARATALRIVSLTELDEALGDPWIDELIQADISDWISFSAETRNMPKLLISDKRILHGLPSGEADFIRVMEKELGLSPGS